MYTPHVSSSLHPPHVYVLGAVNTYVYTSLSTIHANVCIIIHLYSYKPSLFLYVYTHTHLLSLYHYSTTIHIVTHTSSHLCIERLMSQITQQVENGTLPNMAENLLSSSHLYKRTEQKATSDTKSLLSIPSDTARHKRVPCCNSVGEDGENAQTNRKARAKDQQCAVTGRTVKRHLAAVDEGMKATRASYHPAC